MYAKNWRQIRAEKEKERSRVKLLSKETAKAVYLAGLKQLIK